jgi:hypothetical protein
MSKLPKATRLTCLNPQSLSPPLVRAGTALQFTKRYATNTTNGRRQVTVLNDDGRVNWGDLSGREKAARTTQQTFNFAFVAVGLVLTVRKSIPFSCRSVPILRIPSAALAMSYSATSSPRIRRRSTSTAQYLDSKPTLRVSSCSVLPTPSWRTANRLGRVSLAHGCLDLLPLPRRSRMR